MTERPKIAFVLPSMVGGGVSKMLLDILKTINCSFFDVDILLLRRDGEKLDQLPDGVTVKQMRGIDRWESLRRYTSAMLNKFGLKRLFHLLKIAYHRFGHLTIQNKKNTTNDRYDIVIAFQDGLATWYTAKKISGMHKLAIIHTDFEKAEYDVVAERKLYACFEQIYCTSEAAKTSFLHSLPEFSKRTKVLLPIVDSREIHEKVMLSNMIKPPPNYITIVTVARLSYEKGIDVALQVLSKLQASGYSIKWFFVGDGVERRKLEKTSKKMKCVDGAVFMGDQSNPYELMAIADVYVQPSRYESYCIALAEAMALGCAIVTTDFPGAREQLGTTGGIITGMSADSLYDGIVSLIDDPDRRKQFALQSKLLFSKRESTDNLLLQDIEQYTQRGDF